MLRKRKNKRYNEETNDEDGGRRFNLKEKIRSERFEQLRDLQELTGHELTLKLIQRQGFDKPILVTNQLGLELSVPAKNFVVRDVGKLVGYDRLIDVMDVKTQKNIEMTMKEWCKYYESRHRERLLNVISLEFSHTDLDDLVESPKIVRLLDWVDQVWPKFLKESQTESTNSIDKMKYPKVQKYCLMSVKGSYTDFHIDFGGTSVWYHILRGKKIFWMIPPTELNLQTFEEWTLSGMQQDVFFGDTVEECFRVELTAGDTFFIPSGWIHAVYTLEDSLVFGGNFLHSFGIENQLKVSRIEDATKVPLKFRYPFYTEILWYVVQHYVYCLTGNSHLHNSPKNSATTTPEKKTKKITDSKANRQSSNIITADSATESEQDDSDKNHKRSRLASSNKKRGRPTKHKANQKPSEDDESTEIDSESEDVKPTKSTTTCRMTKNSLLRLQYEIDEPLVKPEHQSSNKSSTKKTKSAKDTSTPIVNDDTVKIQPLKSSPKTKESPTKSEHHPLTDAIDNYASNTESNTKIVSNDANQLNGWSTSQSNTSKAIWSNEDTEPKEPSKIYITRNEVSGLKLLVKYLSKLSGAKKNLPNLIRNSRALLDDCKKVVAEHEKDDPELAVTGIPITSDLLNIKKSDINQLIEQFFKPNTATSGEDNSNSSNTTASKNKSVSATLMMQQRLKYNQNNHIKAEEKIHTSSEGTSSRSIANKETKCQNIGKKSSGFNPSPVGNSTNPANQATDNPRPKSPPTRPLSNKQYSSRTKNDKVDNNLVLPGLFADLIAATSTQNEVFNVSSADVTSSLFGAKSPSKSTTISKESDTISAAKKSPFDLDLVAPLALPNRTCSSQKIDSSKSPEPPKLTPSKRFITPSHNRPQAKERLIFASAPYVSPIHASERVRNPFPWQNPYAQIPQPNRPQQQLPRQQHQLQTHHDHVSQIGSSNKTTSNLNPTQSVVTQHVTNKTESAKLATWASSQTSNQQQTIDSKNEHQAPCDLNATEEIETKSVANHSKNVVQSNADMKLSTDMREGKPQESYNTVASESKTQTLIDQSSESQEEQKSKKTHKIRGLLKKSKEARQAIETSPSSEPTRPSLPVSVIKFNTEGQVPVIVQNSTVSSVSMRSPSCQPTSETQDMVKPKAKRAKKLKDEQPTKKSSKESKSVSGVQSTQPTQPIICGLVRPPVTSALPNPPVQAPRAGQQYLISRPVMFNTLPAFSGAHLPHLPSTSMPVFSTAVPTSMGLPNMQPGARIVWATRPRAMPVPTSTSIPSNNPNPLPAHSKKIAPKPQAVPTDTHVRQPDNAALLSLATTALSTSPLPTTPTVSNITSRLPNPAQAYVINPNMFAAQQFFNPYLQRLPMVQFATRDPNPATMISGSQFRFEAPRAAGQLLFAPVTSQAGQPRYLITQPGFLAQRPQSGSLFSGHQPTTTMSFAPFNSTLGSSSSKQPNKMKKVKTR